MAVATMAPGHGPGLDCYSLQRPKLSRIIFQTLRIYQSILWTIWHFNFYLIHCCIFDHISWGKDFGIEYMASLFYNLILYKSTVKNSNSIWRDFVRLLKLQSDCGAHFPPRVYCGSGPGPRQLQLARSYPVGPQGPVRPYVWRPCGGERATGPYDVHCLTVGSSRVCVCCCDGR